MKNNKRPVISRAFLMMLLIGVAGASIGIRKLYNNAMSDKATGTDMRFSIYRDCTTQCFDYILANGKLAPNTAQVFESFITQNSIRGPIFFNSVGGNLEGGLKLGEAIRKNGYNTYVGNQYQSVQGDVGQASLTTIVQKPVCYSSCAYAFLGGVKREVSENAEYGIHDFRNINKINTFLQTVLVGDYIKSYLDEMGIKPQYYELVKETSPKDMYVLSKEQARMLNVDNTQEIEKTISPNNTIIQDSTDGRVEMFINKKDRTDYTLGLKYSPFLPTATQTMKRALSGENTVALSINNIKYLVVAKNDWVYDKNQAKIFFELNEGMIQALRQANKVELIFQSKIKGVNPSILLSQENLIQVKDNL